MWVLGADGSCSVWASAFYGIPLAISVADSNADDQQDVIISAAMQTVLAVSNGSAFDLQYAGSSGVSGSTEMAPFLIHEGFGDVCPSAGTNGCICMYGGVDTHTCAWACVRAASLGGAM